MDRRGSCGVARVASCSAQRRVWLRSFEARRLAVHLAYRKMPARYRPHKSELNAIAKELDAWAGSNEAVFVGIRRNDDDPNHFRHTMSFGIKNRALQYLVLLVYAS